MNSRPLQFSAPNQNGMAFQSNRSIRFQKDRDRALTPLQAGWADWFQKRRWDYFVSLDYLCPGRHPHAIEQDFAEWLFRWQVIEAVRHRLAVPKPEPKSGPLRPSCFEGKWINAYKSQRLHATGAWARTIEPGHDGKWHIHALIEWPKMLERPRIDIGKNVWTRESGHLSADIQVPRDQQAVTRYVAKMADCGSVLNVSQTFSLM